MQARSGQMDVWFSAKNAILHKDEKRKLSPWIMACNLQISCNLEILCMFGHDKYPVSDSDVVPSLVSVLAIIMILGHGTAMSLVNSHSVKQYK